MYEELLRELNDLKRKVEALARLENGTYVHPNHTGDVTSAGDGATTIANDAVTYAKMQNVSATDRLLGRSTAGAGNVEEIALTAFARSLIDDVDAAAGRTTLGLGTMALAAETAYLLLAGRAGGQVAYGGTAANEDLTLEGTSHATKTTSYVILQPTAGNVGIRTATPAEALEVAGNIMTSNNSFYKTKTAAGTAQRILGMDAADILYLGGIDVGTTNMRILIAGDDIAGVTTVGMEVLAGLPALATDYARVGGVMSVQMTTVGNVGTGVDTLATYSVPARTLGATGHSVWFEAWGTFAANANNKGITVVVGGVTEFTTTVLPHNGGSWHLRGRIVRTGSAAQKGIATFLRSTVQTDYFTGSLTLSSAFALTITGEATSNNDIVLEAFMVGWDNTNA